LTKLEQTGQSAHWAIAGRHVMLQFHRRLPQFVWICVFSALGTLTASGGDKLISVQPIVSEAQLALTAQTLGILVNENDPNSIELGERYAEIRGVPAKNIMRLKLPNVSYVARHLMVRELERIKQNPVYSQLAGFVLAFDKPFRVDANQSITSAISQGISTMRWQGNCNMTVRNPDYGKPAGAALDLKPSMMLTAGGVLSDSLALARRGSEADHLAEPGQVVLWKTKDQARSAPREASMERARRLYGQQIPVVTAETREAWQGLIGLQTGLPVISDLDQFGFLPGAFADHLTSLGGVLDEKNSQTPATAWIKAGATASYGTVREPCNFPGKFPDPERLLSNYLSGDTILEAYWKSVSALTEGLFVGEPLARPFSLLDARVENSRLVIRANRQTLAYLKRQARRAETRGIDRKLKLGLFWVETGNPEWFADLDFSNPPNEGDLLFAMDLPPEHPVPVRVGVMLRR
jgi:uncharacterized protein (TIGR03790 family)